MRFGKFGLTAFALAMTASTALAGEIVLNSDQSDPAPKKAMEGLIADFEKANPGVTVKWNNFDHEGYKSAINNFLKANPPDVAAWYGLQPGDGGEYLGSPDHQNWLAWHGQAPKED